MTIRRLMSGGIEPSLDLPCSHHADCETMRGIVLRLGGW